MVDPCMMRVTVLELACLPLSTSLEGEELSCNHIVLFHQEECREGSFLEM